MANKRLLASAALAAGLLGGGVAGVILGVPGVSSAQTTTVPNAPNQQAPGTTVPNDGQQAPSGAPHDGKNCPHMGSKDGGAPDANRASRGSGGAPSSPNAGFRQGPGNRV